MKRIPIAGLVVALLVCAAPAMAVDLLAGKSIDVGDVTAVLDGDILHVTYETTDGWALTETHLAVGKVNGAACVGIPTTKKGNPIPGQFPYSSSYNPPETSETYDVDVSDLCSVIGTWTWTYHYGGGDYEHTMIIESVVNGVIHGHGFYNPDNGYTWDLAGTVSSDGFIRFIITYTGKNAGYTVTSRGAVNDCESMSGVATGPAIWDATRQSGGGLCIAAHAAVVHIADGCQNIYSDSTTQVVNSYAGGQTPPAAVKNFGAYPFAAVAAWEPGPYYPNDGDDDSLWQEHSLWDQNIAGIDTSVADWIWDSRRVVNPVAGDVVDFERTFTIPGMYFLDKSGSIHITCDNGYELFLNGNSIGFAQVSAGWRTSDLTQTYVDTSNWQSVENYDVANSLRIGTNTFAFETANEYFGPLDGQAYGTISSNPGGLIYEAKVCYKVVDQEETAWGAGIRFPGANNWATYFIYTDNPAT